METFSKENLNATGKNYVAVVKLFERNDLYPYAITINGYILVRAGDRLLAVSMAFGAHYMLRAMGYETCIRIND